MKAGFGVADITPRVGVQLYGFGPYLNRCGIAVRDRLEARAAAFESEGKRVVVVGCDLCVINDEIIAKARKIIRAAHPELEDRDILINASHTHSGPSLSIDYGGWGYPDPPYAILLPRRIARAACAALDALEDVEYSLGIVPCEHIGLNRVHDKDCPPLADVLKPDWTPAKPELTDTECRVLKFTRRDGSLAGFVAHFGCHPVVCCQQCRYIHGDYPAVAIHELMRQYQGAVGVFLQGAEGDINSGCVHKPEPESMLALDVFAGRFANAVRRGLDAAKPVDDHTIRSCSKIAHFTPDELFTEEEMDRIYAENEALFDAPDATDSDGDLRMAAVNLVGLERMREIMRRGEQPGTSGEVHGVRLGPCAILGSPFETMQGIRREVDAKAQAPVPLVTSLCDGTLGYASDREAAKLETRGARYGAKMVPLINGRLPLKCIHDELAQALLEMDRELFS
ncbi:MAG: neutral/alkaline non-lysosomal ceramidase N-terminal domain-containing protein [Lentisphaeria bacterium]|nr:neutral/alkaline non-lysosomal ceramidase N-terminal domain-containing protein [Lentisphaeria bacterium]